MVIKRSRVRVGEKTALKKFHEHGVYFRKLLEKPVLTEQGEQERLEWARKRRARTKAQWLSSPHAIIDNKQFQIFTNANGRDYAARRRVRGVFRKRGEAPKKDNYDFLECTYKNWK